MCRRRRRDGRGSSGDSGSQLTCEGCRRREQQRHGVPSGATSPAASSQPSSRGHDTCAESAVSVSVSVSAVSVVMCPCLLTTENAGEGYLEREGEGACVSLEDISCCWLARFLLVEERRGEVRRRSE